MEMDQDMGRSKDTFHVIRGHHIQSTEHCFLLKAHLITYHEKYRMRAYQWGNDFNTLFPDNSQYIMIFWILQPRWVMLLVLGGHLVTIGDGYW